jgi:hypothetical protein
MGRCARGACSILVLCSLRIAEIVSLAWRCPLTSRSTFCLVQQERKRVGEVGVGGGEWGRQDGRERQGGRERSGRAMQACAEAFFRFLLLSVAVVLRRCLSAQSLSASH